MHALYLIVFFKILIAIILGKELYFLLKKIIERLSWRILNMFYFLFCL